MKAELILSLIERIYPIVRPVIKDAVSKSDNEIDDMVLSALDFLLNCKGGE